MTVANASTPKRRYTPFYNMVVLWLANLFFWTCPPLTPLPPLITSALGTRRVHIGVEIDYFASKAPLGLGPRPRQTARSPASSRVGVRQHHQLASNHANRDISCAKKKKKKKNCVRVTPQPTIVSLNRQEGNSSRRQPHSHASYRAAISPLINIEQGHLDSAPTTLIYPPSFY